MGESSVPGPVRLAERRCAALGGSRGAGGYRAGGGESGRLGGVIHRFDRIGNVAESILCKPWNRVESEVDNSAGPDGPSRRDTEAEGGLGWNGRDRRSVCTSCGAGAVRFSAMWGSCGKVIPSVTRRRKRSAWLPSLDGLGLDVFGEFLDGPELGGALVLDVVARRGDDEVGRPAVHPRILPEGLPFLDVVVLDVDEDLHLVFLDVFAGVVRVGRALVVGDLPENDRVGVPFVRERQGPVLLEDVDDLGRERLLDALLERLVLEDRNGDGLDVRVRLAGQAVAAGERRGEEERRDQAEECAGSGF